MNNIAFAPVISKKFGVSNIPDWQLEIKALHTNHFAIEMILERPLGLSTEVLIQCRALREELISTMEDFLKELDRQEQKGSHLCQDMDKVLRKHAGVMNKLNYRVSLLLKKQRGLMN